MHPLIIVCVHKFVYLQPPILDESTSIKEAVNVMTQFEVGTWPPLFEKNDVPVLTPFGQAVCSCRRKAKSLVSYGLAVPSTFFSFAFALVCIKGAIETQ